MDHKSPSCDSVDCVNTRIVAFCYTCQKSSCKDCYLKHYPQHNLQIPKESYFQQELNLIRERERDDAFNNQKNALRAKPQSGEAILESSQECEEPSLKELRKEDSEKVERLQAELRELHKLQKDGRAKVDKLGAELEFPKKDDILISVLNTSGRSIIDEKLSKKVREFLDKDNSNGIKEIDLYGQNCSGSQQTMDKLGIAGSQNKIGDRGAAVRGSNVTWENPHMSSLAENKLDHEEEKEKGPGYNQAASDRLNILSFGTLMEKSTDKASTILFRKETDNWETEWITLRDELKKKANYEKYAKGKLTAWLYIARETIAGKTTLLGMAKGEKTKSWNNLFKDTNLKICNLDTENRLDAFDYCTSKKLVFTKGKPPNYLPHNIRSRVEPDIPDNIENDHFQWLYEPLTDSPSHLPTFLGEQKLPENIDEDLFDPDFYSPADNQKEPDLSPNIEEGFRKDKERMGYLPNEKGSISASNWKKRFADASEMDPAVEYESQRLSHVEKNKSSFDPLEGKSNEIGKGRMSPSQKSNDMAFFIGNAGVDNSPILNDVRGELQIKIPSENIQDIGKDIQELDEKKSVIASNFKKIVPDALPGPENVENAFEQGLNTAEQKCDIFDFLVKLKYFQHALKTTDIQDINEKNRMGNLFAELMTIGKKVSGEKGTDSANKQKKELTNKIIELKESTSNLTNIVTHATEMDSIAKSSESQRLPLEPFKESSPQIIQGKHEIQLNLEPREKILAADLEKNKASFDPLDQVVEEKNNEIGQGIMSPSQNSKDTVVLVGNAGVGKSPILNGSIDEVAVHSNNLADIQTDQFEKMSEEFSTKLQLLENNMKVLQEPMAQQQEKARQEQERTETELKEEKRQQGELIDHLEEQIEKGQKRLPPESFKESLSQIIQRENKIQPDLQLRVEISAADVEKKNVPVHSNNVTHIQTDQFEKISTKLQFLETLQEQMAQQQARMIYAIDKLQQENSEKKKEQDLILNAIGKLQQENSEKKKEQDLMLNAIGKLQQENSEKKKEQDLMLNAICKLQQEPPLLDTSLHLDEVKSRITKLFDGMIASEDIPSFLPSVPKKFIADFVNSLQNPSKNQPLPVAKLLPLSDDNQTPKNFGFYHLPSLPDFSNPTNIKTFIVLGETGSGKTTLIDSISNYILDVQLNDPFRYKVVDESQLRKTKTQTASQTDDVTIYRLEGKYGKVQIIDTPGFGDTRGIDTDELITKKIAELFKTKLESLDYILFVVKSTETRLTDRARWIYHKMQELFGVDLAKNIVIMATFCDGGKANCVQALRDAKSPHSEIFYFNNSGIMTCPFQNDGLNLQTKRFWRMGMENFKIFMDFVKTSSPVSLNQTKDVIKYRESIELTIKTTQDKIELSQTKMTNLKMIMRQICDIKDIQNASKDYLIYVEEPQVTKEDLPSGRHTTTCLTCNFTCHEYCTIPSNADKKGCSAMDKNTGNCNICPSKCFWARHANLPYVFKYSTIKKPKTLDDLKKKYHDARNSEDQKTQLLNGLCSELKDLTKQVLKDFEIIRDCFIALEKIALKPHGFECIQYLKDMIQSEQAQKRDGYESRINQLQMMEKRMSELQKIHLSNGFQDLLPKYEKDIDDYLASLKQQDQLSLITQDKSGSCSIF